MNILQLFRKLVLLVALTPSDAFDEKTLSAAEEVEGGKSPHRPNILYFYVDDMGWGSIGPNGQAERRAKGLPSVRTPNLDRLAAEGVNFRRGYGCHVCSPARSSQQSGFHQGHTFADRNDPNNAKKAMRADEVLMGDVLSEAGYVTGYWGKWGYGGTKDLEQPEIVNVQTLPTSHGYQHVLAELHHVRAHTFFQPTLWSAPASKGAAGGLELVRNSLARYRGDTAYPEKPALQNHREYPETAYCDDSYAFAALDFVRRQGQNYHRTGQPFFGLLAVQIPHAPFDEIAELPNWAKAYADDPHFESLPAQARQWAAMVTRIDAHFGNILAALEDPDQDGSRADSIVKDTLVVFQSDNGGPGGKARQVFDSNGGLSGTKGKIQEGGIRVPLVMRWPRFIHEQSALEAGASTDKVVDVTDLLPTFCELAGASPPLGVDGVSIAPLLRGRGHGRYRDFIIHEAGNGQSIIRSKHKLVRGKRGALRLYDLAADRAERRDIAGMHPELVKELHAILLGERVDEPRGFATTYHRWIGSQGASACDAENWSDYVYANDGVIYMTDEGAPRRSWIARIENAGGVSSTARAGRDLEFLALEIKGHSTTAERIVPQSLVLGPGVNLTGRNEIRLSAGGKLVVDRGSVKSLRWLDIRRGATLIGRGTIDAIVYNVGVVASTGQLKIRGDYHQGKGGMMKVSLESGNNAPVVVDGVARLGGKLAFTGTASFELPAGESFTILAAGDVRGEFSNSADTLIAADGQRLNSGLAMPSRPDRLRCHLFKASDYFYTPRESPRCE